MTKAFPVAVWKRIWFYLKPMGIGKTNRNWRLTSKLLYNVSLGDFHVTYRRYLYRGGSLMVQEGEKSLHLRRKVVGLHYLGPHHFKVESNGFVISILHDDVKYKLCGCNGTRFGKRCAEKKIRLIYVSSVTMQEFPLYSEEVTQRTFQTLTQFLGKV